ncbi:MAG: carbohydrate ABC transporter permease [Patescibacteria group bacterium]
MLFTQGITRRARKWRPPAGANPWELVCALIILAGAASMIVPFVWMLSSSLKTTDQFYNITSWFIKPLKWENYLRILGRYNFLLYFYNTLKITLLSVFGAVLSCSLVAFALARLRFPGRDAIFAFILVSMFLPSQVTLIPIFIIFKNLGFYNTHLPLVVPAFFGNAFGIFLLRQFFKTIPDELEDAARVDGCGPFRMYLAVFVPLVKPALITLGILTFQGAWGDILNPLIYLVRENLYTMVLGVRQIARSQYMPRPELELAGNMILIAPIMLVYLFAQRYFTESIAQTGLKG